MDSIGYVYVHNNPAGPNSVSILSRYSNGTLTPVGTTVIGGQGTGQFVDTQGSLILDANRDRLFCVDEGSNQISVVAIEPHGVLKALSVSSSSGVRPLSICYSRGRVYVVNQGDANHAANVAGFSMHSDGTLKPIPGSTQPLSAAQPDPGQVQVDPDGDQLIVTEKGTNKITSYTIHADGSLSSPTFTPSAGTTPFGFAFSPKDRSLFVVSDAGTGAATSYRLEGGNISVVSGPVGSPQTRAACWVAITKDGQYVYTGNAGSNTIATYNIGTDGKLTLQSSIGNNASSGFATEIVLTPDNRYLYILSATFGSSPVSLGAFRVQSDGSLMAIGLTGISLPSSSSGIAVI
ncbi:MAG: beta-propeller fold lactonase family protein [Chloroflexi bacterium]|nr:beta-propeller fold lactonase family protein [Chloroflexota bacterium]